MFNFHYFVLLLLPALSTCSPIRLGQDPAAAAAPAVPAAPEASAVPAVPEVPAASDAPAAAVAPVVPASSGRYPRS